MKFISSIKSNYGKYLAKSVGVAALGLIGYDAHVYGKLRSDSYAKNRDAENVCDSFMNTQFLTQPSAVMSKAKDKMFHLTLDENVRHFCNTAIGYFDGFGSSVISNALPFTLGLGALLTKGKISKAFAWGTAGYGALLFFKDVLGFGNRNDLNKKI